MDRQSKKFDPNRIGKARVFVNMIWFIDKCREERPEIYKQALLKNGDCLAKEIERILIERGEWL